MLSPVLVEPAEGETEAPVSDARVWDVMVQVPHLAYVANRFFIGFSADCPAFAVVAIPDGDSKGQKDVNAVTVRVAVQGGDKVVSVGETEPMAPERGAAGNVQFGRGNAVPSKADFTSKQSWERGVTRYHGG